MNSSTIIASCCIAITFSVVTLAGEAALSEREVLDIYNKAQQAQNAGQHEEALKGFMAVKKYYPDDWRTRAKIIQEYSILARPKERDAEIDALYELRSKLSKDAQSKIPFFCREQLTAGKRKLMVFEYFALQGERAVKYSFIVLDNKEKKQDFKITLGSYDTTTQIARETGWIGKNERLFHLDGYFADGEHRTYSFFKGKPKYDDVRKMVVEIVEGKRRKISGTKPTKDGATIEIETE